MIIDTKSSYYKQVVMLRHDVLRTPIGLSIAEEDIIDDKNQYIVIALVEEEVVGCLLIKIIDKELVKFRQMAIAEKYQHKRIGQNVISYAENFCLMNEYQKIELHARKSAIEFYTKQEFVVVGNEFEEVGLPHFKMVKRLNKVELL